jgi:hypothetical protein
MEKNSLVKKSFFENDLSVLAKICISKSQKDQEELYF